MYKCVSHSLWQVVRAVRRFVTPPPLESLSPSAPTLEKGAKPNPSTPNPKHQTLNPKPQPVES